MILGVLPTTYHMYRNRFNLKLGTHYFVYRWYYEAMNIKGEEFSDERLEELTVKCLEKLRCYFRKYSEECCRFTHGAEQSDDIIPLL